VAEESDHRVPEWDLDRAGRGVGARDRCGGPWGHLERGRLCLGGHDASRYRLGDDHQRPDYDRYDRAHVGAVRWADDVHRGRGLDAHRQHVRRGAGTGITVAADTVAVDTTVIATRTYVDTGSGVAHKYAAALTGTSSPETVTHNLATRDVQVTVLNGATPYTAVEVDWDATTTNTVTVRYNPNLGAGYRVVVVG